MKHLLIIILSLLILTSPVIGQSSKYESVSQCVLQTMKERELTGNDMFKIVKEECERDIRKVGRHGVMYSPIGLYLWFDEMSPFMGNLSYSYKYVGGIKNKKPNGIGTMYFLKKTYKQYIENIENIDNWIWKKEGEFRDAKLHGQGTLIFSNFFRPGKDEGEWKNGDLWNGTKYDKDGNIKSKYVNGKYIKQ